MLPDAMKTDLAVALVGALGALTSALAGVLLTQLYEFFKRRSEEKRWYAQFFLGKKIDAISILYAALIDYFFVIDRYLNSSPPTLLAYYENFHSKKQAYWRAVAMATIYMDSGTRYAVVQAANVFDEASTAILLSLPDDECPLDRDSYDPSAWDVDQSKLIDAHGQAVERLSAMLNPDILEKVTIVE